MEGRAPEEEKEDVILDPFRKREQERKLRKKRTEIVKLF